MGRGHWRPAGGEQKNKHVDPPQMIKRIVKRRQSHDHRTRMPYGAENTSRYTPAPLFRDEKGCSRRNQEPPRNPRENSYTSPAPPQTRPCSGSDKDKSLCPDCATLRSFSLRKAAFDLSGGGKVAR